MTENDRKILVKACGMFWHDIVVKKFYGIDLVEVVLYECSCGKNLHEYQVTGHLDVANPAFTTPNDWELVRQSVVVELRGIFHNWLKNVEHPQVSGFEWWLTLSPEECCQLVCNWIKSRPDLFPWVVDFLREKGEGDGNKAQD